MLTSTSSLAPTPLAPSNGERGVSVATPSAQRLSLFQVGSAFSAADARAALQSSAAARRAALQRQLAALQTAADVASPAVAVAVNVDNSIPRSHAGGEVSPPPREAAAASYSSPPPLIAAASQGSQSQGRLHLSHMTRATADSVPPTYEHLFAAGAAAEATISCDQQHASEDRRDARGNVSNAHSHHYGITWPSNTANASGTTSSHGNGTRGDGVSSGGGIAAVPAAATEYYSPPPTFSELCGGRGVVASSEESPHRRNNSSLAAAPYEHLHADGASILGSATQHAQRGGAFTYSSAVEDAVVGSLAADVPTPKRDWSTPPRRAAGSRLSLSERPSREDRRTPQEKRVRVGMERKEFGSPVSLRDALESMEASAEEASDAGKFADDGEEGAAAGEWDAGYDDYYDDDDDDKEEEKEQPSDFRGEAKESIGEKAEEPLATHQRRSEGREVLAPSKRFHSEVLTFSPPPKRPAASSASSAFASSNAKTSTANTATSVRTAAPLQSSFSSSAAPRRPLSRLPPQQQQARQLSNCGASDGGDDDLLKMERQRQNGGGRSVSAANRRSSSSTAAAAAAAVQGPPVAAVGKKKPSLPPSAASPPQFYYCAATGRRLPVGGSLAAPPAVISDKRGEGGDKGGREASDEHPQGGHADTLAATTRDSGTDYRTTREEATAREESVLAAKKLHQQQQTPQQHNRPRAGATPRINTSVAEAIAALRRGRAEQQRPKQQQLIASKNPSPFVGRDVEHSSVEPLAGPPSRFFSEAPLRVAAHHTDPHHRSHTTPTTEAFSSHGAPSPAPTSEEVPVFSISLGGGSSVTKAAVAKVTVSSDVRPTAARRSRSSTAAVAASVVAFGSSFSASSTAAAAAIGATTSRQRKGPQSRRSPSSNVHSAATPLVLTFADGNASPSSHDQRLPQQQQQQQQQPTSKSMGVITRVSSFPSPSASGSGGDALDPRGAVALEITEAADDDEYSAVEEERQAKQDAEEAMRGGWERHEHTQSYADGTCRQEGSEGNSSSFYAPPTPTVAVRTFFAPSLQPSATHRPTRPPSEAAPAHTVSPHYDGPAFAFEPSSSAHRKSKATPNGSVVPEEEGETEALGTRQMHAVANATIATQSSHEASSSSVVPHTSRMYPQVRVGNEEGSRCHAHDVQQQLPIAAPIIGIGGGMVGVLSPHPAMGAPLLTSSSSASFSSSYAHTANRPPISAASSAAAAPTPVATMRALARGGGGVLSPRVGAVSGGAFASSFSSADVAANSHGNDGGHSNAFTLNSAAAAVRPIRLGAEEEIRGAASYNGHHSIYSHHGGTMPTSNSSISGANVPPPPRVAMVLSPQSQQLHGPVPSLDNITWQQPQLHHGMPAPPPTLTAESLLVRGGHSHHSSQLQRHHHGYEHHQKQFTTSLYDLNSRDAQHRAAYTHTHPPRHPAGEPFKNSIATGISAPADRYSAAGDWSSHINSDSCGGKGGSGGEGEERRIAAMRSELALVQRLLRMEAEAAATAAREHHK